MAINKSDLETEMQISFAAGFTTAFFTDLCNYAEDKLKLATFRTTFTGSTTTIARYGMICAAIDRLATSNRNVIQSAISSISEGGSNISFSNGKTLDSYRTDFNRIVADLRLPGDSNYNISIADIDSDHSNDESSILYKGIYYD